MSETHAHGGEDSTSHGSLGNELNFDWPSKSPNEDFRMSILNHQIKRLLDLLCGKKLLLQKHSPEGWAETWWSDEYWVEVRSELELIWSSLPDQPRKLYPFGFEKCFEYFEDFLCEVKFRYYECIKHIPHHPVDESLLKQLECHSHVLKNVRDPEVLTAGSNNLETPPKLTETDKPNTASEAPKRGPGRPKGSLTSDPEYDKGIHDAWRGGHGKHATHEELANDLGKTVDDVKAALKRHQSRLRRVKQT